MSTEIVTVNLTEAPALLQTLDERLSKLQNYSENLKPKAQKMSPEIDATIEKFIVAAKAAKVDFNEKRSPLTRKINEIVKLFTAKENAIQAEVDFWQSKRDQYAKEIAMEIAKKEREKELARIQAEDLINFTSEVETDLRQWIRSQIDALKTGLIKACETVTRENYEAKLEKLKAMPVEYPDSLYQKRTSGVLPRNGHNLEAIYLRLKSELKEELFASYRTEAQEWKNSTIQHMAMMKKTIDKDAMKDFAKEAKNRIKEDTALAMDVEQAKVDANKDSKKAELAFSSLPSADLDMPENRSGYKITVLKASGYAAISAYWFSVCANDFAGDYEKLTIGSMMRELEKIAYKSGDMLDVEGVKYEETFKAVNRAR